MEKLNFNKVQVVKEKYPQVNPSNKIMYHYKIVAEVVKIADLH